MTNLTVLALHLRDLSPAQVNGLVPVMRVSNKWERLKYLKIFADDNLALAAVNQCVAGTLEALSIDVDTDSSAYKQAVKDHPGLKRLCVSGSIPDLGVHICAAAVRSASRSFKNLEWLSVFPGSIGIPPVERRFENENLPHFVSSTGPYRLPFSHSPPWMMHEQRLTIIRNRSDGPIS